MTSRLHRAEEGMSELEDMSKELLKHMCKDFFKRVEKVRISKNSETMTKDVMYV